MAKRLLIYLVISKCFSIFKLLSSKKKYPIVWSNSFFILNFSFHIFNCVRRFNVKKNLFAGKSFNRNLHASSKPYNQVKSRLLLNIVVGKRSSIFKLPSSKNQHLLFWRNSFFILNFSFNVINSVRRHYIKSNCIASQRFNINIDCSFQSPKQV